MKKIVYLMDYLFAMVVLFIFSACGHHNAENKKDYVVKQEQKEEMPDTSGYENSFVMIPKPEIVDNNEVTFWDNTHNLYEYAVTNAFYVINDTICAFEATCMHDEGGFQLFILTQSDSISKYKISSIDSERIVYLTDKGKQSLLINQYETKDLEEHQKYWVWERIFHPKDPQYYQTAEPIEIPDI